MHNILLGVTGSVAAIKTRELYHALSKIGDVKIIATDAGAHFIRRASEGLNELLNPIPEPILDEGEWKLWNKIGDPVLHIDLRRWASCFVVAPLDANTLAKFANGICDNLLTCVFRAWDWNKHVFLAPAMNTMMWDNWPTSVQLRKLSDNLPKINIIHPIRKRLACDDVGIGAMAPVGEIVDKVNQKLRWLFPLHHCNGIPINHHPGAFGFHRRKNHHTGVDLYCKDGEVVRAAEDGTVVKIELFTGPKVGHDWWEETWGVMVEGASGVINYGEVTPLLQERIEIGEYAGRSPRPISVGSVVQRGDQIGNVKRVLFQNKTRPDIPGHSTSMLHLELYQTGTREFADWHDASKNPTLLDPTPYLLNAVDGPKNTLTWGNEQGVGVG